MSKEVEYKTVGVRVSKVMADELAILAKAEHRSISNIIKIAIEEHLNKFFNTQEGKTK